MKRLKTHVPVEARVCCAIFQLGKLLNETSTGWKALLERPASNNDYCKGAQFTEANIYGTLIHNGTWFSDVRGHTSACQIV